jgi:hypothetical protein
MSNTKKIGDFLANLKHPLKSEIEASIKIIREVSPKIQEDVKWGGPSFDYAEPMATFNPRIQDFVAIIFHKGELINDKSGLLEAAPKGKAYVKFRSMKEVEDNKENLQKIVEEWIRLMDTASPV